jgi:hypothetical protein
MVLILCGTELPAWSEDFLSRHQVDFNLIVDDRVHVFQNFLDQGRKKFSKDANYHILYLVPSLSAFLAPNIRGVLEIEGEFIFDLDSDDFEEDIEVRNAYLQGIIPPLSWVSFSVGRQAFSTVGGLIYDDEAPALKAYIDLERGFDSNIITRFWKLLPCLTDGFAIKMTVLHEFSMLSKTKVYLVVMEMYNGSRFRLRSFCGIF